MLIPSLQRNRYTYPAPERVLAPRSPRWRASSRPQTDTLLQRCLLTIVFTGVWAVGANHQALAGKGVSSAGFVLTGPYAVGANAQALVAADVNGDGMLDLITANTGSNSISVLLGLAKKKGQGGTFGAAPDYGVGPGPGSVAVGDFNGDGKLDVVAGVSGGMSVLLGNGDGTFQAAQNSALGLGTYIAVADVNGDGTLDLVSNYAGVSDLLGNGDGTFRTGPTTATSGVSDVAVGDFNGDGRLDVIATEGFGLPGGSMDLMTGNGDGTFGAPQTIYSSSTYYETFLSAVTVADFNADGKPDVMVGSSAENTGGAELGLAELLCNGDGTFNDQAATGWGADFAGFSGAALAGADFNGDGYLDLVAASSSSPASVLFGNSYGNLGSQMDFNTYGYATGLAVGDFNNDGYADVATVGNGLVSVNLWTPATTKKH